MRSFEFTFDEAVPFWFLLFFTVLTIFSNYFKGPQDLWKPTTILVLVMGYYCLLGPYQALESGNTFDRLKNMRPFYSSALWGAFVSVVSCLAGFASNSKTGNVVSFNELPNERLSFYGKRLFIVGFILFTISTGGNIGKLLNPLDAEAVEQQGGSISNYLAMSVNFMIPAVTLLFSYYLLTKEGLLWFVVTLLISVGLYTTLGFRYRLVLLVLSLAITYYLKVNKKPNFVFLAIGFFVFISAMGIINKTRTYGKGLSLERLEKNNKQSDFESGLAETSIFQTSGAIIDYVPKKIPYAGFTPIWSTLIFPIPRVIYPAKNSAEYLFSALDGVYGKKLSTGAALLMYAEHYLAFGWVGIIVVGFLLGWYYKKLWLWFKANEKNPLVICVYAVTVSYLYMIISRGYLPAITMLFVFTVYPIYFILYRVKGKYDKIESEKRLKNANQRNSLN